MSRPPDRHLTDDEFDAYVAEDLPELIESELADHVALCERCAQDLESYYESRADWETRREAFFDVLHKRFLFVRALQGTGQEERLQRRLRAWVERAGAVADDAAQLVVHRTAKAIDVVREGFEGILREHLAQAPLLVRGYAFRMASGEPRLHVERTGTGLTVTLTPARRDGPQPLLLLIPRDPALATRVADAWQEAGPGRLVLRIDDVDPGEYSVILEPATEKR